MAAPIWLIESAHINIENAAKTEPIIRCFCLSNIITSNLVKHANANMAPATMTLIETIVRTGMFNTSNNNSTDMDSNAVIKAAMNPIEYLL